MVAQKPGTPAPGDSENEGTAPGGTQFTPVGKGGKAMQFTADAIFKTLQLVQEARGKKVCTQSSLSNLDVTADGHAEHRQG
jgi:translation initiation factor 3 subunit C